MPIRDWICDVCGYEIKDRKDTKYPPRHCRKVMRKVYKAPYVIWKTPGFTRKRPRPEDK